MKLREFSFTPAQIKPGELLIAIETVVAKEVVNQAIEPTRSLEQRNRVLPTHLVIALVIAMSLWSTDSKRRCPEKPGQWSEWTMETRMATLREDPKQILN